MSKRYPDLINQFPDNNDPNKNFSDVTVDAKPFIELYYNYFNVGNFEAATKILNDNPSLKNMIINAESIQYLYDMCISSQRFYLTDVQLYLIDIVKFKDEWSSTNKYTKYDVVTYIQNGARESYMGIAKDIPINTLPTNLDYYVPLTLRGEQGISGTGLTPRGVWSVETNYYKNDLVSYKNKFYSAKRNNSQSIPKLISDDWEMILESVNQIVISKERPTTQTYGDIWGEVLNPIVPNESNILFHQMNVYGDYINLYPKTKASLVVLNNGKTVQDFSDSQGNINGVATTDGNNKVIQTALRSDVLTTFRNINGIPFNGSTNVESSFVYPKKVARETDFNNLKQPGFYYNDANVDVATMPNRPSVNAFSLIVTKHAGICQISIEHQSSGMQMFIRNFYSTWGPWYPIYTGANPQVNITGNAGSVGTLGVGPVGNNTANKIVRTDGSGYLQCGWLKSNAAALSTTPNEFWCANSSDMYLRRCTPAVARVIISSSTPGVGNTAIGTNALKANITGPNNTAIGNGTLQANTTGQANTAVGSDALFSSVNTHQNVAVGHYALRLNTLGSNQTAVGFEALKACTISGDNTAVGSQSLLMHNSGTKNTAVGSQSLRMDTGGTENTAVGYRTFYNTKESNYNTAVGSQALSELRIGYHNTAVGYLTLGTQANRDLSHCTFIGSYADIGLGVDNITNGTSLGYSAEVTGSNQVQLGGTGTSPWAYKSLAIRSDIRDKTDIKEISLGLEFINLLHPVDYRWDYRQDYDERVETEFVDESGEKHTKLEIIKHPKDGSKKGKRFHQGFIAQEVQQIIKETGKDFCGFDDVNINGGGDVLGLRYADFVAPMVKAMQEMSAKIDVLEAKVAELEKRNK